MSVKIFVISGQVGIGKNYLLKQILFRWPNFQKVVTCVPRKPRPGEVEGVDHYFISDNEAQKMLKNDEYIEHAIVHGRLYGTPRKEIERILASSKNAIMEIDVQGVKQLKRKLSNIVTIFIRYQQGDLEQLIRNRVALDPTRSFSEEEILKRIESARKEATSINDYDYIVENPEGHPEKAVEKITEIIRKETNE